MRLCLIALCCGLALTLAGCRLPGVGGDDKSGPPPGGWPQPQGSRLTPRMCGLLTDADYKSLGHRRRASVGQTANDATNAIDCRYQGDDELTLSLRPNATLARYVFSADLQDHTDQLTAAHRTSVPAHDVVGAADESWFDQRPVYELQVRRGGLLLGIVLGGKAKQKKARDVLVHLANLVLRRLPGVGAKNTGFTHQIVYEVTGTAQALSIDFEDYTDAQYGGHVQNVRLPWTHTVAVLYGDGTPAPARLSAVASPSTAKISCRVVIDGVPLDEREPQAEDADCVGFLPQAPTDGQPASFVGPPSSPPAVTWTSGLSVNGSPPRAPGRFREEDGWAAVEATFTGTSATSFRAVSARPLTIMRG